LSPANREGFEMRGLFLGLTLAVAGITGGAGAQTLQGALKPLQFLVGHWEGSGEVTATGGTARGVSDMTVEADGHLLLRRDRNETLDKAGHREGGLGQMMSIYEEGGAVRGDYVDGEGHVIHYGPATVVDGKSVEFTSVTPPGAPAFRLRYEADGPDALKIWFGIEPPGQTSFNPIAIGEVHRAGVAAPGAIPTRAPLGDIRIAPAKRVDHVVATRVEFAPGQAMPAHHHNAPVVCTVAKGAFAVKIGAGPEAKVGEDGVTLEPQGARIAYFRNLSASEPARLICMTLAADGDEPLNVMEVVRK
jgi:quercetin dioxygenase-like cupin family protein